MCAVLDGQVKELALATHLCEAGDELYLHFQYGETTVGS